MEGFNVPSATAETVFSAAIDIAREHGNPPGGVFVANVMFSSELDVLDGDPVVLRVGDCRDYRVTCRVCLPEGDVVGRVTVRFGSAAGSAELKV